MSLASLNICLRLKKPGLVVVWTAALLVMAGFIPAQAQPPVITSFSPATACQGDVITITGTNFTGATSVKLGSQTATNVTVNSATSITATIASQASSGTITVITPGGTATSTGILTVLPTPKPGLTDISTLDIPFTNCDGNPNYLLKVANNSTVTGTNNSYQIDWGDNTGTFTQTDWPLGAQTSHAYASQGYFSIVLTITPASGCPRSVTYQFYNGKNPLASFTTTNPTTGLCIPAPVEFQIGHWFNNSSGTTYQLNFGDGSPLVTLTHPLNTSNTTQLQSHTYTTSSCPSPDFTAVLKAINGCFTTTYTLNQIIIRKKPVADFGIQLPACINSPVCFTNMTTNGYSGTSCNTSTTYLWDFGDGATSNQATPPCHAYATAGTYSVTLTVSNAACGSDSKVKQITVNAVSPPPSVSAAVNYCQGQQAVPLTATGTGLLWYTAATGGTGSPVAPTPPTNVSRTIIYYVSQTVGSDCESARVPVTVVINATPNAPVVSSPVNLCLNQAAGTLTASGTGLLWYAGSTGGTGSLTAPTPSTASTGTTVYYVSQTVNGCEGPRAAINVIVSSLPAAPVVTSPVTYCENQTAIPLTANGSGLLWYTSATGGAGSPIAPTPPTNMPGSTVYYVSQSTLCGEGPRASITVVVNAGPSASISYSPANLCNIVNSSSTPNPPVAVTFAGTSGGSYSISPSTGLPINATTGTVNPSGAMAGTYIIKYTIPPTNSCPAFTATATVNVNGMPTAVIAYPSPVCTSAAAANVQLTGSRGGTFTSTPAGLAIDPSTGTITPATSTPGTYTITYTILPAAPCPGFNISTSITITQAPSASITYNPTNICNTVSTTTSPNPPLSVTLAGAQGGSYSILPATGLPINTATGTINPSGAAPGIYTITYTIPAAGGCAAYTAKATVTVSAAPTATISYAASPYCRTINTPQRVSVSGTPGGTYSAGPGLSINAATGDINPGLSTSGIYTVAYTIAASPPCAGYTATTSVEILESPAISFPAPTQAICSGGVAVFTPSSTVANTIYKWSVAGTLPAGISGVSSGTASGPSAAISLSFTNSNTSSQSLTIRVTPTGASSNSCTGVPYDLTLVVNPVPAALAPDTVHFCMAAPSAPLTVNPLPGNKVKWYDANLALLNAAPVITTSVPAELIYYATQTNGYGCESVKSKIVSVVHPVAKIISSTYTNPTMCGVASGSIALHVLDLNNNPIPGTSLSVHYSKFQVAYNVSASTDASGTVTIPLTAGTYSNIYIEISGCPSQKIPDVFILKDPNPPAQPVAGYNPPICTGTPLNLTAVSAISSQAGAVSYVWAGPAFGPFADTVSNTVVSFPSAALSQAGTYIVYAIQNNCISPATYFQIAISQSPSKPRISTRTPLCIGDGLSLQASSSISGSDPTLNYLWNGPGRGFPVYTATAAINSVTVQDAGLYSVTVSSPATGCSASSDTLVQIGGYPVVKFVPDSLTLPTGFLLNLTPVITNSADPNILPIKKYEWSPMQDIACNDAVCASVRATIKNNTCYTVKASNIFGCSGSDTICIKTFCQGAQVFIPNAFVPFGNVAENTRLMVRATGIFSVKSFRIFNRWGKIVFERDNFPPNVPGFGWDGRVNGKPADPGVYVYTATVVCENGVPYTFKGNITLL